MKIAYLSTFYPFRGGIAQFNAALYRAFEKFAEVKAYTFTRQYPSILFPGQTQLVLPTDKVDRLIAERILDTINPMSYLRSAQKIRRYDPDLLLTKYWMPFFAPSLGTVCKYLPEKITRISILDNVKPHEKRPGDIKLTKFFLKYNDAFVVMSDTVRDDLLEFKPDAKYIEHIHPLYNHFGEKVPQIIAQDKLFLPFDKKILLFFGFIRDYKGLDLLIEALKYLPEDYHLLIAGEPYGNFDKYERLIKQYGVENRITKHVRYISDDEVPLCFSAADVCVLPYRSATQSGIVAIAYHFDLPVVATNVGSLRQSVEPYDTGYLVAKPDALLLADAIKAVFDQNLLEKYHKNIQVYKSIASWDSLARKIADLHYEIAQQKAEANKNKIKLM
ncbi:MAG TPA: glycosyltransferase [Candidatus Kapabacteria bacterium]|mgnify:CR=1 FL=1|nr:glycosyltransferase [Candidatus Kapabacteria bacterium]HPP39057.1 glycosyltransferase [Candidatus Kapabacteria bacterium]